MFALANASSKSIPSRGKDSSLWITAGFMKPNRRSKNLPLRWIQIAYVTVLFVFWQEAHITSSPFAQPVIRTNLKRKTT
jgi:hypothetical protein